MPPKDSGGASKRGCANPLSCCAHAARSVIYPGVGRVYQDFNTRCVILSQASSSAKVVYRPAWSRRWWASLSVRGERATTGLRRALSEAGEGTVLARPEAQLSGRARAVVLVANDEAKRPSGSQPRHLSMPSMNSTSRVRPVRSLGGFGRGAQQGAGQFRLGGTCRCLAVVRVLGPACSGAPLGFFGGFRSRTAQPPRSGCLVGWLQTVGLPWMSIMRVRAE